MSPPPPCRLHCIFAREAPIGVIFRRGPSKQVQLIRWNVDGDTFEAGQWLKGQIDGSGASLSPNGRYLSYSASNGREIYSVISRPPYLTALAIWFHGGQYEASAGFFTSNDRLLVAESVASRIEFRADRHRCPLTIATTTTEEAVAFDMRYANISRFRGNPPSARGVSIRTTEQASFGPKRLSAIIRWERFEHSLEGLDWVDIDPQGRIVYAQEGCLYRVHPTVEGRFKTRKLADFNPHTFSLLEAPGWARSW